MKKIILFSCLSFSLFNGFCQQSILMNFENRPITKNWWTGNPNVLIRLDETKDNQFKKESNVCLNIVWDSIPYNSPYNWFTDIEIDSLANPKMDQMRLEFGANIWLSFWCNTGSGDTLYVQPLMLTSDHKGKLGAKKMTPVFSKEWVFMKFELTNLEYENWGKIEGIPNFETNQIRCFELGLRNGQTLSKGMIDERFDDVMIFNYEPFPVNTNQ